MTFSTQTKDELARIYPDKPCCQLAELAALVRMDGTIVISHNHKLGLHVATENAAVARKIFRLAKQVFQVEMELRVMRNARLKKGNVYDVRFAPSPTMDDMLKELGIFNPDGTIRRDIKKEFIRKQCCRRSYLRGAFLGAGSVNSPQRAYHLEIITNDFGFAKALAEMMGRFTAINAKVTSRKNWHIVYLKESEQIAAFLSIIGAHQALLKFEDTRILKGMRNRVNRLVNCETANLSKTVNASLKQVENIKFIDEVKGISKLPKKLQDIAKLRLENPDISLKELGEMMVPPIGKSGVNHRMRKLDEYTEELKLRLLKKTGNKRKADVQTQR